MAEPTFIQFGQSTWTDTGSTDETASSVSWETGDRILVFGGVANNGVADTLATPIVSGLSFSLVGSVNLDNISDDTRCYLWLATAAGNGSGSITSVTGTGDTTMRNGLAVLVYRGSDGLGTPATLDGSTAKTIALTRTQANSHVALIMGDWAQQNDVAVTATPTGTVRMAVALTGQADFFVVTYGDQGAAGGPTAYGITDHVGTVDMSGIVVEIFGSAGGAEGPPLTLRLDEPELGSGEFE